MSFVGAITVEEKSTLIGDDSFRVDDPVMPEDRVDAKSGERTVLPVCNARQYRATNMSIG